jgi:hypothetical protein
MHPISPGKHKTPSSPNGSSVGAASGVEGTISSFFD